MRRADPPTNPWPVRALYPSGCKGKVGPPDCVLHIRNRMGASPFPYKFGQMARRGTALTPDTRHTSTGQALKLGHTVCGVHARGDCRT